MSNHYWTSEDNELIRLFYYCYTACTSASTRNRIFRQLQPKLNYLINNAVNTNMSSWSLEDKEEAHQDAMLKVWQVLSTKLDDKKIKAVLQFLWIVVNNALISVTRQHLRVKKPKIEYMFCEDTPTDDYDEELDIDQDKLREIIYTELDRKIIEQEKVRTNAFYLMQLKQYLENNNCNGEGFQSYILQTMGITKENFYQINYTLGLKSGVFKDKKNKKQKL